MTPLTPADSIASVVEWMTSGTHRIDIGRLHDISRYEKHLSHFTVFPTL